MMQVEEEVLFERYTLVKLAVSGSTQISKATATILSKLSAVPLDNKPIVIALTAKARYANKVISIVEIAKRELAANNTKYFQYNALRSEMTEILREPKGSAGSVGDEVKDQDGDSDDAFQVMGSVNLTGPKKRAVPVMTTYLSSNSIRELKAAYGEQRE